MTMTMVLTVTMMIFIGRTMMLILPPCFWDLIVSTAPFGERPLNLARSVPREGSSRAGIARILGRGVPFFHGLGLIGFRV